MAKSEDWQWQIPLGIVAWFAAKSWSDARITRGLRGTIFDPGDADPPTVPADLAADYNARWRAMVVRPERLAAADEVARRMASREARYRAITDPLGVPWYWLAAVHELEHSGRFTTSMVVTDPIDVRPGQPIPDATITDAQWDDTARALLRARALPLWRGWDVPGLMYQWERYNGMGYRPLNVPSPYLWSFSNQYTAGKFIRAGVFSPTTVSAQPGTAVLLRRLIDLGAVTL
jgi:lysozyme family protein